MVFYSIKERDITGEQFDEESRKEYMRIERAQRKRRRRASSRNSRRSSRNRKDLDLETNR